MTRIVVRTRNGRTPTHNDCDTRTDTQNAKTCLNESDSSNARALVLANNQSHFDNFNISFFRRNYRPGDLLRLFIRF